MQEHPYHLTSQPCQIIMTVFFSVLFSKSFHGLLTGNTKPKNKCYHCTRPNKARPRKVLVRGPYNNLMEKKLFYFFIPRSPMTQNLWTVFVLILHSISYFCSRGQFAVCIFVRARIDQKKRGANLHSQNAFSHFP